MATIKEVAKRAGVSVSSVSNVLNSKVNVSSDVYLKVTAAIEELNYNPSFLASNLKNNKTKLVAVILPKLDEYYCQMLRGIHSAIDEKGYIIITKVTHGSSYLEDEAIAEVVNMRVNAILAVSSNSDYRKYQWAESRKVCVVLLDRWFDAYDSNIVTYDNFTLTMKLAKTILRGAAAQRALPSCPVVLVRCKNHFSDELDSENGYALAMREDKLEPSVITTNINDELAIRDIVSELDTLPDKPPSYIVTHHTIAECLDEVLKLFDINGMIYCLAGNQRLCDKRFGNIRYVRRDPIRIGIEGGNLLLENIKSPLVFQKRKIVVETEEDPIWFSPAKCPAQKVLRILTVASQISEPLVKLYKNFSLETGIRVEFDQRAYSDLYTTIIRENQKNSETYDIFLIDFPWHKTLREKGALLDLRPFATEGNDVLEGLMDNTKKFYLSDDGSFYVVPYLTTTQFLFYRMDLFGNDDLKWEFYRKYGIPLKPPKNWVEFETIAEYYTKAYNSASPVEYGTAIEGKEYIGYSSEFLPRQWSYKGRIVSDKKGVVIDSAENKKALQSLCNAYRYSPKEAIEHNWGFERDLFMAGKIAMLMTFATHIPPASRDKDSIDITNYGMASIPGQCPILGGFYLGINAHSAMPRQGYEFIKWSCSSKIATYITLLGGLPPNRSIPENSMLCETYPWIKRISKNMGLALEREVVRDKCGRILDFGLIEDVLRQGCEKALKKEQTVENVLAQMKSQIMELIQSD